MEERLIKNLEKSELCTIAEKLGIGNITKKNKAELQKRIILFSYSQIKSAMK